MPVGYGPRNIAQNAATTHHIGMETGFGSVDKNRQHGPTEIASTVDGYRWVYGQNTSGAVLAPGAVSAAQASVNGNMQNVLASGAGYSIDKPMPPNSWYWAKSASSTI